MVFFYLWNELYRNLFLSAGVDINLFKQHFLNRTPCESDEFPSKYIHISNFNPWCARKDLLLHLDSMITPLEGRLWQILVPIVFDGSLTMEQAMLMTVESTSSPLTLFHGWNVITCYPASVYSLGGKCIFTRRLVYIHKEMNNKMMSYDINMTCFE